MSLNNTIYKYGPLRAGRNDVKIPLDGLILSVGVQDNEAYIWAKVNVGKEEAANHVVCGIMTGETNEIVDSIYSRFIGTVLLDNDKFVLHFFDVDVRGG